MVVRATVTGLVAAALSVVQRLCEHAPAELCAFHQRVTAALTAVVAVKAQ
jgi:hypothetical protein